MTVDRDFTEPETVAIELDGPHKITGIGALSLLGRDTVRADVIFHYLDLSDKHGSFVLTRLSDAFWVVDHTRTAVPSLTTSGTDRVGRAIVAAMRKYLGDHPRALDEAQRRLLTRRLYSAEQKRRSAERELWAAEDAEVRVIEELRAVEALLSTETGLASQ